MGKTSDFRHKEDRGIRLKRVKKDKRKGKQRENIESVLESIWSRGESLGCLCLFRKQRSAVVHQNGRSRTGSPMSNTYIEKSSLGFDRDLSTRCWFFVLRAKSSVGLIDVRVKKKRTSDKTEENTVWLPCTLFFSFLRSGEEIHAIVDLKSKLIFLDVIVINTGYVIVRWEI